MFNIKSMNINDKITHGTVFSDDVRYGITFSTIGGRSTVICSAYYPDPKKIDNEGCVQHNIGYK